MATPTAVELLWNEPSSPRRGPRPALTREAIVADAIALADAEGLGALSMQRLAERLGCAKMALYRYVPAKGHLTALMLDAAVGGPPDLSTVAADGADDAPWRAALREWSRAIFERYSAHPWTVELAVGVRPVGPCETAWLDAALTPLTGSGLTGAERLDAVVLLNGHLRGLVQQVRGLSDADVVGITRQYGDAVGHAADRFPAVAAALAEEAAGTTAGGGAGSDAYTFGVERILDGLAVLMERRR